MLYARVKLLLKGGFDSCKKKINENMFKYVYFKNYFRIYFPSFFCNKKTVNSPYYFIFQLTKSKVFDPFYIHLTDTYDFFLFCKFFEIAFKLQRKKN